MLGMIKILHQALILLNLSCQITTIPDVLVPLSSARVSSVYQEKDKFSAKNAIDGNVTTVIHTKAESLNWLIVTLDKFYFVSMVTVINRIDPHIHRLVARILHSCTIKYFEIYLTKCHIKC